MRRPTLIGFLLAMAAVFWPFVVGAQSPPNSSVRLLGQHTFESRRTFEDTTLGGLSGLAYDAKRNVFYAVSDDRGENQAPRFYTLEIDFDATGIQDVRFTDVTFLDSDASAPGVQPYERGETDFEEIVYKADDDTLIVSSERDRENRPWVRHFNLDGTLIGELPIPPWYMTETESGPDGRPQVVRGIRPNFGIEGMALLPSQQTLYLANEQALAQDGPMATAEQGTNVRILRLELYGAETRPTAEYVYPVEKVFAASTDPNVPSDNGVTSLVWVRHLLPYDLLVLERAFALGSGNEVNVFGVNLDDATDVRDVPSLPAPYTGRFAKKTLLANMKALGVTPDNLEALALGPRLPNGNLSLIVLSDDNFSAAGGTPQVNQFVLLEIAAGR